MSWHVAVVAGVHRRYCQYWNFLYVLLCALGVEHLA